MAWKIIILDLYQLRYLRLNSLPRFENWQKLVKNMVLILVHISLYSIAKMY